MTPFGESSVCRIENSSLLHCFTRRKRCIKRQREMLVANDGKTLRLTFGKRPELKALHLVTIGASENGMTAVQVACEEKSNDITAIAQLLTLLNLKGCTVTINAMDFPTDIFEEARAQSADYVFAMGNQPTLLSDLQEMLEACLDTHFADVEHQTYTTFDKAHGRTSEGSYQAIDFPAEHRL